jgi:hypothetical protein
MFSFNWSFNACSTSSSDGKETTGGTFTNNTAPVFLTDAEALDQVQKMH